MSGIAQVAFARGIEVSGSDLKETRYMRSLLREGIEVKVGHDPLNVADPKIEVVVVSTAVPRSNPEYAAALKRGLTIWPRAQMLAYLGEGSKTLAVAGTHGKTTTSSMLATTLVRLDAKPTFLIGGVVDGFDATAHVGTGEHFVVEADESDGSFTYLDPSLALITNIEEDHLDHYESLDEIKESFSLFLEKLRPDGTAVVCADCAVLLKLAHASGKTLRTYGLTADADVRCVVKDARSFEVVFADGQSVALSLPASPGEHNMLNATGVLATLDELGFDRQKVATALSAFSGVRRRFDRIGEVAGVTVVDDYGHHPTEVAATLKAASELGYAAVHVLFQPHRYTRTQAFTPQFGAAFDAADTITIMEVYSAGEAPIPGVNGQSLVEAIKLHDPQARARFIEHRAEVPAAMAAQAKSGDLIITMGAGDVTVLAPLILEELRQA
jgi:UDP-N-acetylmuramate--alanine ligase